MNKPKDEINDLWDCESVDVFENIYRLIYRHENSSLYCNSLERISRELDRCSELVELKIKKCRNNKL